MCDLKVERVSGCVLLKQVIVIGLHNFNECTEADALSDLHDNSHFSGYYSQYIICIFARSMYYQIIALLYTYITSDDYSNPSGTLLDCIKINRHISVSITDAWSDSDRCF